MLFSPNVSEFLLRQPYITDLRIFNSFAYAVYVRTHVRTNVRPFVRSSPGPGKVTSAHRGQVSSVSVHCTPHIRPTCFACRSIIYRCTHVLGICVCVGGGVECVLVQPLCSFQHQPAAEHRRGKKKAEKINTVVNNVFKIMPT